MTRAQVILTTGAILLVIGLFQLPRVVVENELDAEVGESHGFDVSATDEEAIASLKSLIQAPDSENYVKFADSLARYYLKYGLIDSAASVSRTTLRRDSSLSNLKNVASVLYTVFERSPTPEGAELAGAEARRLLETIVDSEPENLSATTRLAMTLVVTENPMLGITLLRDVVARDPAFREAILNLGLLSMRSGQYDRGVARFDELVNRDSTDFEAMFYLGICYEELGRSPDASELFEKIAANENADPALQVAAREYLSN